MSWLGENAPVSTPDDARDRNACAAPTLIRRVSATFLLNGEEWTWAFSRPGTSSAARAPRRPRKKRKVDRVPVEGSPIEQAVAKRLNARAEYSLQLRLEGLDSGAVDGCRRKWLSWACEGCGGIASDARPLEACGDRLCPLCASQRSAEIGASVLERVTALGLATHQLAFVTLTIRNVPELDKAVWSFLREAHERFRILIEQRFPGSMRGGFRSFEVTWSPDPGEVGGTWHPHVHMLVDMDYVAQEHLSDAWLIATEGAGFVVDVRRLRGRRGLRSAIKEVGKYATKVIEIDAPGKLRELKAAIYRARLVENFGTFRKKGEEPDDACDGASDLAGEKPGRGCAHCGCIDLVPMVLSLEDHELVPALASVGARSSRRKATTTQNG